MIRYSTQLSALVGAFMLLIGLPLRAQLGLTPGYRLNDPQGWVLQPAGQPEAEVEPLLGDGLSFGLDYEIRLQEVRVQFMPELSFGFFQAQGAGFDQSRAVHMGLFAHAQFYFLDWYGDCDCPTFSKSGGLIQKGLFFRVSPGLSYLHHRLDGSEQVEEQRQKGLAFSIGAGLGLDIGLSDRFTLTPLLEARYFPSVRWDGLGSAWSDSGALYQLEDEQARIWQVHAGLRLGLRLDP